MIVGKNIASVSEHPSRLKYELKVLLIYENTFIPCILVKNRS